MKSRWLRLLLIMSLANLVPVAESAAGVSPRIHALSGKTTFRASETSSALIRFPTDVNFLKEFRASFQGDGRVQGFILRKTGEYKQEGFRPVIENITIGQCARRGCSARNQSGSTTGFGVGKHLSGVWELYIVADGSPVTVTFRIEGLAGRSHVPVNNRARAHTKTLRPVIHETHSHAVYSAGHFTSLTQADYGVVGLWVVGTPHLATGYGDCIYYGEAALPETVAFMPGCPAADGEPDVHGSGDLGRGGVVFTSAAFDDARGLGGWYTTAAVVERYGAVALWIDF